MNRVTRNHTAATHNSVQSPQPTRPSTKPKLLAIAIGAILGTIVAAPALSNPTGGQVVAGQAAINGGGTANMQILQGSQNAIINWQDFSIGHNESVSVSQPDENAMLLNHVQGGQVSDIQGSLTANGKIVIVNPNGIVFGKDAKINVHSLIGTTSDINHADFMDGKLHFTNNNATGTIENHGQIHSTAKQNGLVALVAPHVSNHGIITAYLGNVALASGNEFTVDFWGDQLIQFQADPQLAAQLTKAQGSGAIINNTGTIKADGGTIQITAQAAKNVVDNIINLDGVIQAQTVNQKDGVITLAGPTSVNIGGTLDASANANKGQMQAGTIDIQAQNITIAEDANVIATGPKGGDITIEAQEKLKIKTDDVSSKGAIQGGNITIGADKLYAVDPDRYIPENPPAGDTFENVSIVSTELLEQQLIDGTDVTLTGDRIRLFDDVSVQGQTNKKADLTMIADGSTEIKGDLFINGKLTMEAGDYAELGAYMWQRWDERETASYIAAADGIEVSAGDQHSDKYDQIRVHSSLYTNGVDITFHDKVLIEPNSSSNEQNLILDRFDSQDEIIDPDDIYKLQFSTQFIQIDSNGGDIRFSESVSSKYAISLDEYNAFNNASLVAYDHNDMIHANVLWGSGGISPNAGTLDFLDLGIFSGSGSVFLDEGMNSHVFDLKEYVAILDGKLVVLDSSSIKIEEVVASEGVPLLNTLGIVVSHSTSSTPPLIYTQIGDLKGSEIEQTNSEILSFENGLTGYLPRLSALTVGGDTKLISKGDIRVSEMDTRGPDIIFSRGELVLVTIKKDMFGIQFNGTSVRPSLVLGSLIDGEFPSQDEQNGGNPESDTGGTGTGGTGTGGTGTGGTGTGGTSTGGTGTGGTGTGGTGTGGTGTGGTGTGGTGTGGTGTGGTGTGGTGTGGTGTGGTGTGGTGTGGTGGTGTGGTGTGGTGTGGTGTGGTGTGGTGTGGTGTGGTGTGGTGTGGTGTGGTGTGGTGTGGTGTGGTGTGGTGTGGTGTGGTGTGGTGTGGTGTGGTGTGGTGTGGTGTGGTGTGGTGTGGTGTGGTGTGGTGTGGTGTGGTGTGGTGTGGTGTGGTGTGGTGTGGTGTGGTGTGGTGTGGTGTGGTGTGGTGTGGTGTGGTGTGGTGTGGTGTGGTGTGGTGTGGTGTVVQSDDGTIQIRARSTQNKQRKNPECAYISGDGVAQRADLGQERAVEGIPENVFDTYTEVEKDDTSDLCKDEFELAQNEKKG